MTIKPISPVEKDKAEDQLQSYLTIADNRLRMLKCLLPSVNSPWLEGTGKEDFTDPRLEYNPYMETVYDLYISEIISIENVLLKEFNNVKSKGVKEINQRSRKIHKTIKKLDDLENAILGQFPKEFHPLWKLHINCKDEHKYEQESIKSFYDDYKANIELEVEQLEELKKEYQKSKIYNLSDLKMGDVKKAVFSYFNVNNAKELKKVLKAKYEDGSISEEFYSLCKKDFRRKESWLYIYSKLEN